MTLKVDLVLIMSIIVSLTISCDCPSVVVVVVAFLVDLFNNSPIDKIAHIRT